MLSEKQVEAGMTPLMNQHNRDCLSSYDLAKLVLEAALSTDAEPVGVEDLIAEVHDAIDEYREGMKGDKFGPHEWPTVDGIKTTIAQCLRRSALSHTAPPVTQMGGDDAPLTISRTVHEIAHNLMIAHTGQEGGCPKIDWYKMRGEISDALAVALDNQRKIDTLPQKQMGGIKPLAEAITERLRQIETEGWTPSHDDSHAHGEMARAAAAYCLGQWELTGSVQSGTRFLMWRSMIWPWSKEWWKPKTRREDLIRAAALIIAEIERLDRADARPKGECPDCGRQKAQSADDAASGMCPKWWAIRDADAERDCERAKP